MSLQTYALCSPQDVLDALGMDSYPQPGRIEALINSMSRQIIRRAGREFKPLTTATTRSFSINALGEVVFGSSEPRLLTTVIANTESTAPTTLAATDYQAYLWPDSGAYQWLDLLSNFSIPRVGTGFVSVTSATWGWATVPDDVFDWCIFAVVQSIRRNAQIRSTAGSADSGETSVPAFTGLPNSVKREIDEAYRTPMVA